MIVSASDCAVGLAADLPSRAGIGRVGVDARCSLRGKVELLGMGGELGGAGRGIVVRGLRIDGGVGKRRGGWKSCTGADLGREMIEPVGDDGGSSSFVASRASAMETS